MKDNLFLERFKSRTVRLKDNSNQGRFKTKTFQINNNSYLRQFKSKTIKRKENSNKGYLHNYLHIYFFSLQNIKNVLKVETAWKWRGGKMQKFSSSIIH